MKRKTLRKIIYFLAAMLAAIPVYAWIYANYVMEIDTAEVDSYYDLLVKRARPGSGLVLDLGVKEGDGLALAADRLKSVMGLGMCGVTLSWNDLEKPPAYITDDGKYGLSISLSNRLKGKGEQISVLVHELGHAYVRRLDNRAFAKCDEERLVDCAGVFLGLGVLVLNGMTDDFLFLPGGEYETQKKFFGYLKPEQFGYLFGRYAIENGIPPGRVMPHLRWAGKKYFTIGLNYARRKGVRPAASPGAVEAVYWCPKCGVMIRRPFGDAGRDIRCPKCGAVITA